MIQQDFIEGVVEKIQSDEDIIGLAVGGSFITEEVDAYSDVDLVVVTRKQIAPDKEKMLAYARTLGDFLSGFTGEHVGEKRLLICLYDKPLLHVDIKFLTVSEFRERIENPSIVWDPAGTLKEIVHSTRVNLPKLDYQWIEDRFWIWVHYAALKLGRGENFEALEFLSFVRSTVTSPLLLVKNGQLPRGLRKVEFNLDKRDLSQLIETLPTYSTRSIFEALDRTIVLYRELRKEVFPATVAWNILTEERSLDYLSNLRKVKLE